MNGRDWKPGDVAIVGVYRIFCHEDLIDPSKPHRWIYADGSGDSVLAQHMADAHPMLVIDPEDREQVERFREICSRWADQVPYSDMREPGDIDHTDAMQAALREFANPRPRIEEPTGLGAVVEDGKGERWVRGGDVSFPWCHFDHERVWQDWSQINAVRVVHEGVPS